MFRNSRVRTVLALFALVLGATSCSRTGPKGTSAEKTRLPDTGYRVEWTRIDVPPTLAPGGKATARVTIKNTGTATWPNIATADQVTPGAYAVRLSHRWWPTSGDAKPGEWDGRAELPAPLAPGDSVTLAVNLKAPAQPGDYKLQFDLVQELVVWFENKGAAKALIPVSVR